MCPKSENLTVGQLVYGGHQGEKVHCLGFVFLNNKKNPNNNKQLKPNLKVKF